MRLLLALLLAVQLAPGLGEVVESAVHLATEGHLAHADASHDAGDRSGEHGCGTTQHTCGCCASQVLVAAPAAALPAPLPPIRGWQAPSGALRSLHEPTPPFRPPIAS